MIVSALIHSACGCAAALATVALVSLEPGQAPQTPQTPSTYRELPLTAIPVVRGGRLRGLSFVRIGASLAGAGSGMDDATLATLMADALHDATLGTPSGLVGASGPTVDPAMVKAAVPVRLKRLGLPLAIDHIVVLQAEFRSTERLRDLARKRPRTAMVK